jgi:MatE
VSLTSPAESPAAASPLINAPPGFLAGPVVPTLLRLALPTIVVLVVQTMVGVIETYFIGFLGTAALAGTALVFPVLMLMQMMSNGGMGGGVASAVARAIGAGRRRMPRRWPGMRSFSLARLASSSPARQSPEGHGFIARWAARAKRLPRH